VNVPSASSAVCGKPGPAAGGGLLPSGEAAPPREIQGSRLPARSKKVTFGRRALVSSRAIRAPTWLVALRIVHRTERGVGRVQRFAPSTRKGARAAIRFLGTSISTPPYGPSEHDPVIRRIERAAPALTGLLDHLSAHENADAAAMLRGSSAAAVGTSTTTRPATIPASRVLRRRPTY
jgi:hypothetical protein